jgi:hypothetical protein
MRLMFHPERSGGFIPAQAGVSSPREILRRARNGEAVRAGAAAQKENRRGAIRGGFKIKRLDR